MIPERSVKFVCGPSLSQVCWLVCLYASLAFILLYQPNTGPQIAFDVLMDYSNFMVGVSTVIAALAAVHGVNNWVKHVKHAEYFKLIWEAKKALGMYRVAYLIWSQQRGIFYDPDDELDVFRHKKNTELLDERRQNLHTVFLHLDAVFSKGEFNWVDDSRDFIAAINQYKTLLLKTESTREDDEKSRKLIKEINERYENTFRKLELLEQSYSR